MNDQEKQRAIEITKEIRITIRNLIEKHSSEVSRININSTDPHAPIIGVVQMAFGQAALEYMITSGAKPMEALQTTCNVINYSMQQWVNSIVKEKPR